MPINTEPPKICPKCGSKIGEFKGISGKTGKPYHFWKCMNVDCDYVWRPPSKSDLRHEEIMNALRILYKEQKEIKKLIEEKIGGGYTIKVKETPDKGNGTMPTNFPVGIK
jgi:ssDNA-binding Zn-finger/Zn-ribbon topoisomerase 1